MASFLTRQFRKAKRIAAPALRVASRVPGLKTVARSVPGLGLAVGAWEIGQAVMRGGGGGGSAPPAPFGDPGLSLPGAPGSPATMGRRSIFRDDPNLPAFLKQFAIDDRFLRSFVRAPKGFVVLKDENGDPYALPKKIAQQYGLWKPAKKPPISVRQWTAMQSVKTTMRQLRKIEATGRQLARLAAPRGNGKNIGTTNYIVEKGPGDVIQFPRRRKAA